MLNLPKETVYKDILPKMWGGDADVYIKAMDEAGIDKSMVMTVDFGMNEDVGEATWSVEEMNQWVATEVDKYPDRLFALCAVDPRRGEKAVKLVEKAVLEWGMKGVKFHPTSGFYPDDPAFYPLYGKCVELDVPLCSHTSATIGAPFMSKYANPMYLDTVAAKFPELKVLMIHFGSIAWRDKCMEILATRPNMYAELSGYQAQALLMPEDFLKRLDIIINIPAFTGAPARDKIMFGTDWPYVESIMNEKEWVSWFQSIPEKAGQYGLKIKNRIVKNILSKNTEKFFKL